MKDTDNLKEPNDLIRKFMATSNERIRREVYGQILKSTDYRLPIPHRPSCQDRKIMLLRILAEWSENEKRFNSDKISQEMGTRTKCIKLADDYQYFDIDDGRLLTPAEFKNRYFEYIRWKKTNKDNQPIHNNNSYNISRDPISGKSKCRGHDGRYPLPLLTEKNISHPKDGVREKCRAMIELKRPIDQVY
mmetsp:Transcript_32209/g.32836  ORF Transcript_32209/g.32836 Transcript_32209/m.32836 type:complete len:190 (+) Transcript_32209:214-783(+)